MKDQQIPAEAAKFSNPDITASGEMRAKVALRNPRTLWFNTGTLCNIECIGCYIESSPKNDRLVYLSTGEIVDFLDQLETRNWGVSEIGITGGEPFMNPDIIEILRAILERDYKLLVLTNAMRPMMRKRVQAGLQDLNRSFPGQMTLRISLDHWSAAIHDRERGLGAFEASMAGMRWLRDQGITMAVAGRRLWADDEDVARRSYGKLFDTEEFAINANDPSMLVLFEEMDEAADVPEITTACWDILGKSPDSVMCASSRMIVKRKGAGSPCVLACTLLAYEPEFELGKTLEDAERDVALNHPHCAKFCVLGGSSCS